MSLAIHIATKHDYTDEGRLLINSDGGFRRLTSDHNHNSMNQKRRSTMAVGEQVFGFFIPTVTLMGVGAHKEVGKQVKVLGGKKPFICTD